MGSTSLVYFRIVDYSFHCLEIYNVLGEEIYQTMLISNTTQINLNERPNGVYFYRVLKETGELVGSGKLIITCYNFPVIK